MEMNGGTVLKHTSRGSGGLRPPDVGAKLTFASLSLPFLDISVSFVTLCEVLTVSVGEISHVLSSSCQIHYSQRHLLSSYTDTCHFEHKNE